MNWCGMTQEGYILMPVALAIALIGASVFLLGREGGVALQLSAGGGQAAEVRYVAEAGLAHVDWLTQNSGCTGYPALADVSFDTAGGAHSYSASVTPDHGSPVSISATGTLDDGTSRTLVRSEVEVFSGPITETLPLGEAGMDTYVNAQAKTTNYGVAAQFGIDSGGAHDYYALLQIDPAAVPDGPQLLSAQLQLYMESFGGNSNAKFTAYRLLEPWTEGTGDGTRSDDGATHTTSDGATPWSWPANYDSANPVATAAVNAALSGWHTWDVTPLMEGWRDGTYPNHGLVIIGNNQVRDAFFASDESPSEALRPRLEIIYACPCGGDPGSAMILQPGPIAGQDTYLFDGQPSINFGTGDRVYVSGKFNRMHHGLLRFDLSGIPAGATIDSAILELNLEGISSTNTGTVSVHRLTRSWSESQATWSIYSTAAFWTSPGGDYDPTPVATTGIDIAALGPRQWDVTPLVEAWVSGSENNNGLLLTASSEIDSAKFTSSDGVVDTARPKLAITYSCPCGTDCSAPPPPKIYRDEFNSMICDPAVDYAGSDGTLDWSPWPWSEVGEGTDSCLGGIKLKEDLAEPRLFLSDATKQIARQADLSGLSSATLSFDYRRESLGSSDDALYVMVWGVPAVIGFLGPIAGPGTDAEYQTASFDISAFISPTTTIQFRASGLAGSSDAFYIDNVQIDETDLGGGAVVLESPATLGPVADAGLYESFKNTNFGSDTQLQVGKDGKVQQSLLRFDITGLPADATVTSARLRLYVEGAAASLPSLAVGAYRATGIWEELTVTFTSFAGQFDPAQLTQAVVPISPGWVEWALPVGLIHEWRDEVNPNHGLLLKFEGNDKNNTVMFASRENATLDWRPQLVLEFTQP
ncbi:MAG: hypothetical protein C0617_11835 [Desulfuromonas sp.]|uniref:DNRLRE domain-containing protein n=1 Tax=Desulfuromonas sp. TaxID=892 RepID=UPI000CC14E5B|nr:DNRLRE domain-containing protein [Desulfuromonas sp.]PLX83220.1 MAG: hypothetical protein C0617_11835 [Desulfuromonas sp.]